MSAFATAPLSDLSPPALFLKFMSSKDPKELKEIFEFTLRNKIQFPTSVSSVIDKLPPELTSIAIKDYCETHAKEPQSNLMIVIDDSGSMSSFTPHLRKALTVTLNEVRANYKNLEIILFGMTVQGPYPTTDCLNSVFISGGTNAVVTFEVMKPTLAKFKEPFEVLFFTDGEFDGGFNAYFRQMLPNITKFVMLFPPHTPPNAEINHREYLPTITPPGIFIDALRADIDQITRFVRTECRGTKISSFNSPYYVNIGDYAIFQGMSISGMHKIIERILQSTDTGMVSTFFSNIVGAYEHMVNNSGSLQNVLRTDIMKVLWQLVQPLKRRLTDIPSTHPHHATASAVLTYLDICVNAIIDKRDKRNLEIDQQIKVVTGIEKEALIKEKKDIQEAFSQMRRVNDMDRIIEETKRMIDDGNDTIYVKFRLPQPCVVDAIFGFPNVNPDLMTEVFNYIASLGTCSKSSENSLQLVLDPKCRGIINIFRQMFTGATLTPTLVTRILMTFYTKLRHGYIYDHRHIVIANLIHTFIEHHISPAILSNITCTNESVNLSPIWLSVLCEIGRNVNPRVETVRDKLLWTPDHINVPLLDRILDGFQARKIVDYISNLDGETRDVKCSQTIIVPIPNFNHLIHVGRDIVTWQDWAEQVIGVEYGVSVTNSSRLQERIKINSYDFIKYWWSKGHPKINKSGGVHPVETIGQTHDVREAVRNWFAENWLICKQALNIKSESTFPTVTTDELKERVVRWFEVKSIDNLPSYQRLFTVRLDAKMIIPNLNISQRVQNMCYTIPPKDKLFEFLIENPNFPSTEVVEVQVHLPEVVERIAIIVERINFHIQHLHLSVIFLEPERKRRSVATWEVGDDVNLQDILINMEKEEAFDPQDFECPILCTIFEDPVVFDGHIYERSAITNWLRSNDGRSPMTRRNMDNEGNRLEIQVVPPLFMAALKKFKS